MSNLQSTIRSALLQLLQQICSDDYHCLNKEERNLLNKMLLHDDTELIHSIIIALKKIGDSNAIPYLQALVAGKASAAQNDDIQQAAKECLLILQKMFEQEHDPQILLRPSTAVASPDMLLRPASDTIQPTLEEAAQLLRPTVEQRGAERETPYYSTDDFDRLVFAVKTKMNKENRASRTVLGGMFLVVLVVNPIVLLFVPASIALKCFILVALMLFAGITFKLQEGGVFSKIYYKAVLDLVAAKRIEALGTLADALRTMSPAHQETLKIAMIELLKQINDNHVGILSQKQENALWLYFVVTGTPDQTNERHVLYAECCLEALSKIGSARTFPMCQYRVRQSTTSPFSLLEGAKGCSRV